MGCSDSRVYSKLDEEAQSQSIVRVPQQPTRWPDCSATVNEAESVISTFHKCASIAVAEVFYRLPDGMTSDDLSPMLRLWFRSRPFLLVAFSVLPFVVYRNHLDVLAEAWFAPVMACVACAIPASGAPLAGGVIFLPVLNLAGLCARDAVAFTALTQTFGVGIFSPLNWLVRDPGILSFSALGVCVVPALLGMFQALMITSIRGIHGDHIVTLMFSFFCVVLAVCGPALAHTTSLTAPTRGTSLPRSEAAFPAFNRRTTACGAAGTCCTGCSPTASPSTRRPGTSASLGGSAPTISRASTPPR